MEKKNNKGLIIAIVVLSVLVVGLGGYIIYDKINFKSADDAKKEKDELSLARKDEILKNILVYDDGLIKGFIQMNGREICKIYVDTFFQNENIGSKLIEYAITEKGCAYA